jgi:hypothetical protein
VTSDVVWYAVKQYAKRIGVNRLAPHDLRRTCARLCHGAGGELEQIQFLLDRASVQTTERYIGCRQNFREAVNDRFQNLTRKQGALNDSRDAHDNPVYHVLSAATLFRRSQSTDLNEARIRNVTCVTSKSKAFP